MGDSHIRLSGIHDFLVLRGETTHLIDQTVDNQARVTAVTLNHTMQLLVQDLTAERTLVAHLPCTWLLEVEQAETIGGIEHDWLTDAAVEVEHIQAHALGGLDLLLGIFLLRYETCLWEESPTDGGTEHHTIAIETRHGVLADAIQDETTEAEGSISIVYLVLSLQQLHLTSIEVRMIQVPDLGIYNPKNEMFEFRKTKC